MEKEIKSFEELINDLKDVLIEQRKQQNQLKVLADTLDRDLRAASRPE
ncbi:MAG: hypothetical protein KAS32_14735 [Candidatus Peribacteraceae bacterium]|nr:hypothetical protein [Candidatus Peribacteraceae bacterium]